MVRALSVLWLCGLALRMTVLAIPPVIPLMHASFELSQATVAALMSLPVLLFSFAAIPGSLLVARHGPARVLTAGIVVTAIAGALRGAAPDVATLFVATFAMGAGIAIMQPALPSVVRDWVPRKIALGTATYSNGLLVGEALSASLTIPVVLPLVEGSWRWSVAAWSVPVILIAAVSWWLRPASHDAPAPAARSAALWWPDWRDPLTWRIGLISGYASSLYFANNAFLPDYLAWRGHPELLNATLSALNWAQMPASALMLFLAHRLTLRRWPFIALGAVSVVSLAGMLALADEWVVAFAAVTGFCNAFLLILTLALPPMLARSDDVHRLSAAMIAIGYLCAFLIPIIGGMVWDLTGSAPMAFAPLFAFALVAIALAAKLDFSRERAG